VDLYGRDDGDRVVIVENQLTVSDHKHLGQLMRYFGHTDADVVVWVAPGFTDADLNAVRRPCLR
jgi:RecB family endonuclease NucS